MKPPWTTQSFITINSHVGKWPVVDRLMIFAAHYLVFLLLGVLAVVWYKSESLLEHAWTYGYVFFLSLVVSYTIAFFWRQPRPVKQLPYMTVLIQTCGTWKSFPSDHAIAATILGVAGWQMFSGVTAILFAVCALLIAVSRVWVGVHYPRDIVGGIFLASTMLYVLG